MHIVKNFPGDPRMGRVDIYRSVRFVDRDGVEWDLFTRHKVTIVWFQKRPKQPR